MSVGLSSPSGRNHAGWRRARRDSLDSPGTLSREGDSPEAERTMTGEKPLSSDRHMSPSPHYCPSEYQRLRIRFRKEGDLRWISHRDLVRTWERLCRRAALTLRMSEGFHPKPKLSFPSALGLGIESLAEVMELELTTPVSPEAVPEQLNALAPPGLTITHVEAVSQTCGKARVRAMRYQFPIPNERRQQVEETIELWHDSSTLPIARAGRPEPIDLKADLMSVTLEDGAVCFTLRATDRASARPRDVLQALGLADLEQHGHFLTRCAVELAAPTPGSLK